MHESSVFSEQGWLASGIFILGLGEILSGFAIQNVGGLFVIAGVVMGAKYRYVFIIHGA